MGWKEKRMARRSTAKKPAPKAPKPKETVAEEKPKPKKQAPYAYDTDDEAYICNLCGKVLKTEQGMENHVKDKH